MNVILLIARLVLAGVLESPGLPSSPIPRDRGSRWWISAYPASWRGRLGCYFPSWNWFVPWLLCR